MKAPVLLLSATLLFSSATAQTICAPAGNVVIYSNYDGGDLNIVVDENIPDIRIGVVSYEFSRINISGPFAGNVTAVWYAGYNGDNDNCNTGAGVLTTTINGVALGITDIQQFPPSTWANAFGYSSIICNYSCDVFVNQGGCNTADQIAHYFLSNWGGVLRFQHTQYACWGGPYQISAGGNCCADPLSTGVAATGDEPAATAFPNPATTAVNLGSAGQVEVMDATGRTVMLMTDARGVLDVAGYAAGVYTYRMVGGGRVGRFVVES